MDLTCILDLELVWVLGLELVLVVCSVQCVVCGSFCTGRREVSIEPGYPGQVGGR